MKTETFLDMYYPRSFCDEYESKLVESRDLESALKLCPKYCYFFQFRDVITRTATREDGKVIEDTEEVNKSERYYIDGELVTADDIKKMAGGMNKDSYSILLSNMKCNNWGVVIKTRRGTFHPPYSLGQVMIKSLPEEATDAKSHDNSSTEQQATSEEDRLNT